MKSWMSVLFGGLGLGIGFFAGVNYEKRKQEKDIPVEPVEPERIRRVVLSKNEAMKDDLDRKFAEDITKAAGYAPEDEDAEPDFNRDIAEVELYLSKYEHPEDDTGDEDGDDIVVEKSTWIPPHTIRGEEYYSNISGYDQSDLTYYEEDDILCDEEEKVIDDPDMIVGEGTLYSFGDYIEDGDDEVYARNDNLKTEYCITRIHNSYGRVVKGLDI